MDIIKQLTQEFKLKENQVTNTVALIDDGNTIPFIARYRKELTGELDDQVLRELNDRLQFLRTLQARKEEVKLDAKKDNNALAYNINNDSPEKAVESFMDVCKKRELVIHTFSLVGY